MTQTQTPTLDSTIAEHSWLKSVWCPDPSVEAEDFDVAYAWLRKQPLSEITFAADMLRRNAEIDTQRFIGLRPFIAAGYAAGQSVLINHRRVVFFGAQG